jgi:hypothetical protein
MPVTTPTSYADDLRDADHFGHVLEHLFKPALEQAGYTVIPPKMLGAALIHAEIIKHLEQADLVLADLSGHNPNVFFELGIRTSLDRPVILVKDARTDMIPFDLGTINVLTYDESLAAWTLDEEINGLAAHVSYVPTGDSSGNAMWRYFGLTKRGGPAEAGSLEEKVDLLLAEVAKLRLTPVASVGSVDASQRGPAAQALVEFLRDLRTREAITFDELADRMGTSRQRVAGYFSGAVSSVSRDQLEMLLDILNANDAERDFATACWADHRIGMAPRQPPPIAPKK